MQLCMRFAGVLYDFESVACSKCRLVATVISSVYFICGVLYMLEAYEVGSLGIWTPSQFQRRMLSSSRNDGR
jgi:hypothetical protein